MLSAELQELFANNRRAERVIDLLFSPKCTLSSLEPCWGRINTRILLPVW